MQRRKFSREFKLEAVRLVKERGVSIAQAARDLDLHENVLRKWITALAADPEHAFPGLGQMKPEQLEIDTGLYQPGGVRGKSYVSLTWRPKNRQQAIFHPVPSPELADIFSCLAPATPPVAAQIFNECEARSKLCTEAIRARHATNLRRQQRPDNRPLEIRQIKSRHDRLLRSHEENHNNALLGIPFMSM
jgi:transposase